MLCRSCFVDHLSITEVSGKSPAGSNVGTASKEGLGVSHEAINSVLSNKVKSSGGKGARISVSEGDDDGSIGRDLGDCGLCCWRSPLM